MGNPLNPLDSIATIAQSVAGGLDALFTSDEEREQAKLMMMKELNKPHIMQAMITLEEAKNPNMFVSGWRPALGWLSVVLLGYAWIARDLIVMFTEVTVAQLPPVDAGQMMTLVLALLGLGATRTYEKVNGVHRDQWKAARPTAKPAAESRTAPLQSEAAKPAKETDFSKAEKNSAFDPDESSAFNF